MCKWYRTADTETAGGNPHQWYTLDGMQFVVSYIRCSGPRDSEITRRVTAISPHPKEAEDLAWRALCAADPHRPEIVSRIEAGVAEPVSTSV